jgi:hypothetical protein
MIMREYALGVDNKKMKEIYDDATGNNKMGFLMLDLEGEPSKRFRSGFDEYYEIDT